ncbi:MAG: serine/threonine protein kinase [Gemmatimonadaceae bacterium]|nr:serine/threonine protein kinase [Gemmatimonadaceae bacterium]
MTDSTSRRDVDEALASDYVIIRELAPPRGMSAFAARSRADGRDVEIKTIPDAILAGGTGVSAAAIAAGRIEHPNILPVLEWGRQGETFYWVSPAADARTLRARLARGGRVDLKDSLTLLRDVAAALTHAHHQGVVHGGLTPDNVLISGGSALIADLGFPDVFAALNRQASASVPGPASAASLGYASPEQASGRVPDARSDVYTWGVIAYELLGGRHPFAGRSTPREMLAAHVAEEPLQLAAGRFDVPPSITRLVMRCLSKEPAKRPESAREVFAGLTKEMLVPPPSAPAGSGQKVFLGIVAALVVAMAALALLTP